MKRPFVSIIIPIYNAANYILETLESVLHQKYKDWELLLIDDGSSDSSVEIVQQFVSDHPGRANLLFHANRMNKGSSASRNLGLTLAKGELICFLDADDVWNSNFLDFYVHIFDEYPDISMAYGPFVSWHSQSSNNGNQALDSVQRLKIRANRVIDAHTLFRLFLADEDAVPSPSGVMFRHSAISKVAGWEEIFQGMYDDQVLYSKLFLCGITIYITDQCLYRYRRHDQSLCFIALKENRIYEARKKYLEWLRQYLLQNGQQPTNMIKIVNEHLWRLEINKEFEMLPPLLDFDGWAKKMISMCHLAGNLVKRNDMVCILNLVRYGIGHVTMKIVRGRKG
jgi:glycosyltransferase involved in cell wall biosynthesis